MTIDVTIIGGYLGAGKTTLVNHLLPYLDGRTVVLVNDFGSIGIDADLIAAADGDTITLANGCICCSMVDGLSAAMDSIRIMAPQPERLIIETSGVAEPAAVAAYTQVPGFLRDAIVVIVDAETIRIRADDRYVGDLVRRQIAQADVVVLNKADLVTADVLADCRTWLTEITERPLVVVSTHNAQAHPDMIIGTDVTRPGENFGPGSSAGTPEFSTASFVSEWPVDRTMVDEWINSLPMHVVRVKGLVQLADGTHTIVQRVGVRVSWLPLARWPGGPSRIVLIGVSSRCDELVPPGFSSH
jgi:G3E family GTPase